MRRLGYALTPVWLLFVGLPLAVLARELARYPGAWSVWAESGRILPLVRNSIVLALGAVGVALPVGTALGLALYRLDLPARFFLRRLLILAMFVPLPLLATAWQSAIDAVGVGPAVPVRVGGGTWLPWAGGMSAAILLHAIAGLPWIVWLTGQGFCSAERAVEEDALVHGGARAAFLRVALPAALPSIAVAALWVGLQTAAEITISDMMQVRTFAEEVYTQYSRPDPGADVDADLAMARALAVAIPPALVVALFVALGAALWRGALPEPGAAPEVRPLVRFHRLRWPIAIAVTILVAGLVLVPLVSLTWKAGAMRGNQSWSAAVAVEQIGRAGQVQAYRIGMSLLAAAFTGVAAALMAWLSCRVVRDLPRIRTALFVVLLVLWCLPGPVVGMGLKDTIALLLDREDALTGGSVTPLRQALYTGPSLLPVMWAALLRFIPLAVALLWPALRRVSRAAEDAARTDGATALMELRHVALPSTAAALVRTVLVILALALGELSAGKLVETPGSQTFASEIFSQMHFGLSNHLAAMCLILLALVALLGALAALLRRIMTPTRDTAAVPRRPR